jgi:hypothetical protein
MDGGEQSNSTKKKFSSFEDMLAGSETPLLVDFYATWFVYRLQTLLCAPRVFLSVCHGIEFEGGMRDTGLSFR